MPSARGSSSSAGVAPPSLRASYPAQLSGIGFFEDFFGGNKRAMHAFWRVANDQLTTAAAR
jgi:hypothetical protein